LALYDNNVFNLLDIAKTSKLIDIFPNIERTRSKIESKIKYMHSTKSHEHFTNEKKL
jgi:hypothetical protein